MYNNKIDCKGRTKALPVMGEPLLRALPPEYHPAHVVIMLNKVTIVKAKAICMR